MKEDGATTTRSDNYPSPDWRLARERNRLKARFDIRQRIMTKCDVVDFSSAIVADKRKEQVQQVLYRIVQGDRSHFSLHFMSENAALLSTPFPTDYLLSEDNQLLLTLMEQKLTSRFGKENASQISHRCAVTMESCTFMEFAVWCQRYHIVRSLLLGGTNPCQRGKLRNTHDDCSASRQQHSEWNDELVALGGRVLRQFFEGVHPSLSGYIVKRVVDMRLAALDTTDSAGTAKTGNEDLVVCYLCHRAVPPSFQLCVDGTLCGHVFCEPCWWKDMLENLHRETDDIVLCPVCTQSEPCRSQLLSSQRGRGDPQGNEGNLVVEAARRSRLSLQKYLQLPLDSKALKKRKTKKSKVQECDSISANWSEAVSSSLGWNQAVRRDKFFGFVEKGVYHYVKGVLVNGIDLQVRNEYGQDALFVATLRGHTRVVELLLYNGSDPNSATSNGGLTAWSVAKANGNCEIASMLLRFGANREEACATRRFCALSLPVAFDNLSRCEATILIDRDVQHAGAGSFIVDKTVSDEVVNDLIDLSKTLPIEESNKERRNKLVPCSVRSYFCDAELWISTLLEKALSAINPWHSSIDDDIYVFRHMRFLCYEEPSTVLAPHVDLCRVHPLTEKRSTHSFLLYLTDCAFGGETTLLQDLSTEGRGVVLARVQPKRARLLVFPHACPHEGEAVVDVPKLLIRGEIYLPAR